MFSRVLNRHQVRWSTSLSRFNFIIMYRPGSQQGRFDALSRHSYLAPKEGLTTFSALEAQAITSPNPADYNISGSRIPEIS
jgi:hypothetical protein